MSSSFVFHDPSGKRWVRVRRLLGAGGVVVAIGAFLFVLSLLTRPRLPSLGLPAPQHLPSFAEVRSVIRGEKAVENTPFRMRKPARSEMKYVRSASPVIHFRTAARATSDGPVVFGYYVNWDRASEGRQVVFDDIGPGYFATTGARLVAGREFSVRDTANSAQVVIVNEAFVRQVCGGSLLDCLRLRVAKHPGQNPDREIVGVVADVRHGLASEPAPPTVYFPLLQLGQPDRVVAVIRTTVEPALVAQAVQRSIRSVDPAIPVYDVKTLRADVDESLRRERSVAFCSVVYAILALTLSCFGLYGLLAYGVTRRYREIGIRIALGASRPRVVIASTADVLKFVAGGIVLGALVSVGLGHYLKSLFFGLEPLNPLWLALAVVVVLLSTIPAMAIPVFRVLAVDPSTAIREH